MKTRWFLWWWVLVLLVGPLGTRGQEKTEEKITTFWQITDIHYDQFYRETANPCCQVKGECCHAGIPYPAADFELCRLLPAPNCTIEIIRICHTDIGNAGPLGTRSCDTPLSLVQSTFQLFQQQLDHTPAAKKPAFVLWTGDNARHDRDPQIPLTPQQIIEDEQEVADQMQATFSLRGIPVLPAIGNNDVFPHNDLAAGPNPTLSELTRIWTPFFQALPNSGAITRSFKDNGYYYADLQPGLRIVMLNTMFLFTANQYATDCANASSSGALQLGWLSRVLSEAAQQQRKVLLAGHVPPANWFPSCQQQLAELLLPFLSHVTGHLYGHYHSDRVLFLNLTRPNITHNDNFNQSSNYNDQNSHNNHQNSHNNNNHQNSNNNNSNNNNGTQDEITIAVVYLSPSVTPTFNPSWREYFIKSATFEIEDWNQYYFPLSPWAGPQAANQTLYFTFEYSPRAAYQLNDLSVKEWQRFFQSFPTHPRLAALYDKHIRVSSPIDTDDFCFLPNC